MSRSTSVAQYIAAAPKQARAHLRELRALLRKAAPNARETIKWSTPVYEEHRILFAFAAFKTHLNFMPTPSAMRPFTEALRSYKTGKGSIQLPYEKPLPKALLRKIAAQRVKDLRERDIRWM